MGFLARLTTEPRFPSARRVPYSPRTLAGVTVTPDTAVQVAAVWACLRYLSQTVAVLPWHVKVEGNNGAQIQSTHPVDQLIWKRPSKEWSSFQFRETLTHWALRWGNGYAEIEWDVSGTRPLGLWPIHPERVTVMRDPETGEIYYRVTNFNTSDATLGSTYVPAEDMFHIRGFGEGPVGVNVIDYASQSIGWVRAAQLFGSAFFGNGMNIAGVVLNKKPLKPDGLKRQRAEFEQLYRGVNKSSRTAFLDNDADWKAIGTDPQKAQLIEVQQFQVEEICRWFGVPPHKVMHLLRATFTNIESQGIEVVVDSITPWVKRFEDEADYKLFGQNRSGFYTQIDMRGLMRGDAAARIAYLRGMREIGAFSPNQVLQSEGENTIGPDGDVRTMNGTYKTLEQIIAGPPEPAGTIAPPPDQVDEPVAVPDPSEDDDVQAASRLFSNDELAAMNELEAMAQDQMPSPQKPRATKTRVIKHDEKGRILEFVQEEVV